MISESVIELTHWQFALSSLSNFLFLPLVLGLSLMVAIMETIYLLTGRIVYKEMTRFWGELLAVSFVLSLITSLMTALQLGKNESYLAYYIGDILGSAFIIERVILLFLEATFIGLFILGWDRLTKGQHLLITWLVTLSSLISVSWLLLESSWMQTPIASTFNHETMRMEFSQFSELIGNIPLSGPLFQTLVIAYLLTATFVLAISAYYLLNKQKVEFAHSSFKFAASLGLVALLLVITFGYGKNVENKPYTTEQLTQLLETNRQRIHNGIKAHQLLDQLRDTDSDPKILVEFNRYKKDLGYGLLLKRSLDDILKATEKQVELAAQFAVPTNVYPSKVFKLMLISQFISLIIFICAMIFSVIIKSYQPWLLKLSLYSLPLSWLTYAVALVISEITHQPWAVNGILPIFLSPSSLVESDLWFSLIGYFLTYTSLLIGAGFLFLNLIKHRPNYEPSPKVDD
ncbi:MAG: cytochrome ubiquinol oxidase subunit I [Methylococcales bacterium]|nr:cytochrome ubiquinol oxidase subunit I [Methylococcales bacterium]